MSDNNLRQKLARCTNEEFPIKTRILSLKKVFGNMQDADAKQSAQIKNSLIANGGIDVLMSIIRCSDPTGPQFDFDQNIFQKGAPDWAEAFVFQADATLALRRLMEIGHFEKKSGEKRVHQAVLQGALDVLIPHLYCTSCAAQYASGALKLIAQYEIYRQNICDAGALRPLLLLLKADPEVQKSSFRNAVECVHLLSCSTTVNFEEMGILEACLQIAMSNRAGEKPELLSVLCAANITAGRDDPEISKQMEKVYGAVNLGVHLCRWLSQSLKENERPYFTIRCSQLDMLRSVCFLATSEVGRLQLISAFIKEDGSQKKLTTADVLMKILSHPAVDSEMVDVILEVFLHLAFSEAGANLLRTCKTCLQHIQHIAESPMRASTDENGGNFSSENKFAAHNILTVLKGSLRKEEPLSRPKTPQQKAPAAKNKKKKKMDAGPPSAPIARSEQSSPNNSTEKNEEVGEEGKEEESRSPQPTALVMDENSSQHTAAENQQLPHVMISYSWAHQDSIIDICKHLQAAGLPYWLDVEQMHGEINDRMAEAIESCSVVIMGVSSKYKLSANCRMEAEYSNASGKQIIPLMMEKGYRADGWLGLLTAGKLWYGVSYDDASREANIASMIDVVKTAVHREARAMSPNCLSRSVALFSKTTPAASTATGLEKRTASPSQVVRDHEDKNVKVDVTTIAQKEGPGPLLNQRAAISSESISLDSISLLIDQMQLQIQEKMTEQLRPVIDSLNNIESRLSNIESKMNK